MSNNNAINFLISAGLHKESKNNIIAEIKQIEAQLSKNPIKIKIETNKEVLDILSKFSNSMKSIADNVGVVNNKLKQQITYYKDANNVVHQRTKTYTDDGIVEHLRKATEAQAKLFNTTQTGTQVAEKQAEVVKNQTRNIESQTASYGRLIKTLKDKNALGETTVKRNVFSDGKGTQTTAITDVINNQPIGYKVSYKNGITPEQEQAKNYRQAQQELRILKQLRTDYYKLGENDVEQQKTLRAQMTLHQGQLNNILKKKVEIDNQTKISGINEEKLKEITKQKLLIEEKISQIKSKKVDTQNKQEVKNINTEIDTKQKTNYDAISKQLGIIESKKIKLANIDKSDINTRQELYKQISKEKQVLDNLYNTQTALSNGQKINTLNAQQTVAVKKQLLQIEKNIQNAQLYSKATGLDAQTKQIESFKTRTLKHIETIRTRWGDLVPKESLIKLQQLENKILQINSADRSITGAGLKKYEKEIQDTTNKIKVLGQEQQRVNRGLSYADQFKIALTRIMQWGISTEIVYGSLRKIREGLETLKELDTLMVDINKVTNLSADAMERMKKGSFDTASGYGRTAQDYLKGVAEFSRAGYDDSSSGLSEVSLLAQNVGELTAEQANQFLLATDAAYKFKGSQEELTKVLDGVNQIDNKFATSIAKVSEGMTVAGSVASNAGQSVAELSAVIGTMTAVTQRSGNEAGRAWRGILMNIRGVKGETEDGEVIDDEALSKSAKALDNVNIKVHELKNGVEVLRNPMEVIKELADKWDSLGEGSLKQSAIIEALGGKYRGNERKPLTAPYVQKCA